MVENAVDHVSGVCENDTQAIDNWDLLEDILCWDLEQKLPSITIT